MKTTNVNQIIENAVGQFRVIVTEAVAKADEVTRAELLEKFNQTVGGSTITTVKARVSKKAAKGDKPKRKVSEATRLKLSENLRKAREAKAKNNKSPAKKTRKTKKK